jgi:hypothetical protein
MYDTSPNPDASREQRRVVRCYLDWLRRNRVRPVWAATARRPSSSSRCENPAAERAQAEFIRVASDYSRREGISYPAWREVGVPVDVLKAAGITLSARRRG